MTITEALAWEKPSCGKIEIDNVNMFRVCLFPRFVGELNEFYSTLQANKRSMSNLFEISL